MSRLRRQRPPIADGGKSSDGEEDLDHDQLPRLESMQLSPIECLVLNVIRCFCHGWARGQIGAWDHAFQIVEQKLGPRDGPPLVARVFALMRSLLREKRSGIRFMPFGCNRICKTEQIILAALQSAQRRDDEAVRRAVSSLLSSTWLEDTDTYLALRTLAALCERCQSVQDGCAQAAAPTDRVFH